MQELTSFAPAEVANVEQFFEPHRFLRLFDESLVVQKGAPRAGTYLGPMPTTVPTPVSVPMPVSVPVPVSVAGVGVDSTAEVPATLKGFPFLCQSHVRARVRVCFHYATSTLNHMPLVACFLTSHNAVRRG